MSNQSFGRLFLTMVAILIFMIAAATGVVVFDGASNETGGSSGETSSKSIALGVFTSDVPEFTAGAPWNPVKIDEFTDMVGTSPAIVMWYQDREHEGISKFDPEMMDDVVSRGAMPIVTWEPWNYSEGKKQRRYALRRILGGKHDDYIKQRVRDAAEWGKPMYLRFAHEINGNWYPWSPGVNDNTSDEYVAVWRHVVGIFRQEGATNVRWVWSPNIAVREGTLIEEVYPGDDYVDWVALDGYNHVAPHSGGRWQTLAEVFGLSYDEIIALAPDKPFMIAETASAEESGVKVAWIRDAFDTDIPTRLPEMRAVIWFDKSKQADWRVDSSPEALTAYSVVAASPLIKVDYRK